MIHILTYTYKYMNQLLTIPHCQFVGVGQDMNHLLTIPHCQFVGVGQDMNQLLTIPVNL
jgi:hypothetical protein